MREEKTPTRRCLHQRKSFICLYNDTIKRKDNRIINDLIINLIDFSKVINNIRIQNIIFRWINIMTDFSKTWNRMIHDINIMINMMIIINTITHNSDLNSNSMDSLLSIKNMIEWDMVIEIFQDITTIMIDITVNLTGSEIIIQITVINSSLNIYLLKLKNHKFMDLFKDTLV